MSNKRYDFVAAAADSENTHDLESTTNRNSIHSVPFFIGIGILIFLGLLYWSVYLIDNTLPNPLTIADEKNYPESFIAERAIHDLELLTNIGPRVSGSYENEVLAVDFLTREINSIIQQTHPSQNIELDLQVVSGAFNLELPHVLQINSYSNVQNVIVKLHGKNSSANSVLVNSHFDSVPTSPGGSDDGINVAVMLEILRKLSRLREQPLHNIIFLFNGAEETPLQASHGFITQHKWARECKVVVNLEACGAGGKIILFQSGPETPWLMKYYSKVPHPYGQAAGEEIFQSDWIPSGTDFRIFRDFGGLVGLDMAFYKDGYRYHTKFDGFKNIPHGSYQHAGDNALSLVKNLANAPELIDPVPTPGKTVYFDILGWGMVSYSTLAAAVVNSVAVIISVSVFIYSIIDFKLGFNKTIIVYLLVTLAAILGSWIIAGICVFLIAFILDIANSTMSYYANPWLIIGLYAAPTVALSGCLLFFVNHEKLSLNVRCHNQAHIMRLIWTIILLLGTILNIRAMYALLLPVLFSSVAFIIIHGLRWQHSIRKWQLVYLISLILPTIMTMYQLLQTLSMFVPLTGRIGSDKNPDAIIGVMTLFFTILITSPYVALITLLRDAKYFFACLGVIFITFFIIVFTPLGFPYSGDPLSPAPQRHWLLHTKRVFHNESGVIENSDAGIFFLNLDRNSPSIIRNYVTDVSKAKPIGEDCEKYLLCGLPLSHARMVQIVQYSTWIPASEPVLPEPVTFIVNSKEQLNSTIVRYNVTSSGSDRLAIYLVPKPNMKILQMSLLETLKQPDYSYNNRQLYFILYTYGKDLANLTFTFDVEVPRDYNGTTVDLALTAIYVHDNKFEKTPYYLKVLGQFPEWTDVTPWLGAYYSYIL